MPKKVLVALPPTMIKEIDAVALAEHRSRSDLIREALRRYIEVFRRNGIRDSDALPIAKYSHE
jgi:metal-responsive CopG/Arc/MetJ family transcriptional regulator